MRVDDGRKGESLLAIKMTKMEACSIVGRGEKSLLSDVTSELRLGTEKQK